MHEAGRGLHPPICRREGGGGDEVAGGQARAKRIRGTVAIGHGGLPSWTPSSSARAHRGFRSDIFNGWREGWREGERGGHTVCEQR
jgi:hypothetical protein